MLVSMLVVEARSLFFTERRASGFELRYKFRQQLTSFYTFVHFSHFKLFRVFVPLWQKNNNEMKGNKQWLKSLG